MMTQTFLNFLQIKAKYTVKMKSALKNIDLTEYPEIKTEMLQCVEEVRCCNLIN